FLISSLQSFKDIEMFFDDFMTDEEKAMLIKRLMLHMMLENSYKASEIKIVLGMSRETIRVHQNIWKKGGKVYKSMLQKIAKRENTKQFWKKVESTLKPFDLTMQSKSNM
ncbi:MAG TPA: Trp family transcriptional regulator, partial [Xanthomonadales bacterium]|nr:Trp family transcriptional regulator [Xanthomonadales bacterium]